MSDEKMVPEKDLMAVKAGLEKQLAEASEQLAAAKQTADTHYTNLLSKQTELEKASAALADLKKEAEQLRPLSAAKEAADKKIKVLEDQLLAVTKQRLTQAYKIPEEKLAGKTLAELATLEEAVKLVGRTPERFDLGTGAGLGAGAEKLSPLAKYRAGFETQKKQ